MKFQCDRCKTRYAIADEKVRGKILKIRCKSCDAVIMVRDDEAPKLAAEATRTDEPQQRTWKLAAYRLDPKRWTNAVDETALYTLSSTETRWIGADLNDVDLYLELASRSDGIEVGGLLTTRTGQKIRDVVVISPVVAPRRRSKTVPSETGGPGVDTTDSIRNNPVVPKP